MVLNGDFLRGSASGLGGRLLHNLTEEPEDHLHSQQSPSDNNDAEFLMFATIIVGFIGLACVVCMVQMFRIWFCRVCFGRDTTPSDRAVIFHDGRVLELNSRQRRAVLEAIFSETSKVSSLIH
jgi:hypothetical protein